MAVCVTLALGVPVKHGDTLDVRLGDDELDGQCDTLVVRLAAPDNDTESVALGQ